MEVATRSKLQELQHKVAACDAALTKTIQTNAPVEDIRAAYRHFKEAQEALLAASGDWPQKYVPR